MNTRIQQRGICACCFREQAVNAHGKIAAHGYQIPHGWHQRTSSCMGAHAKHFGTVAGRDFAANFAVELRDSAAKNDQRVADYRSGKSIPELFDRHGKKIDAPKQYQFDAWVHNNESNARGLRGMAEQVERRVAAWQEAAPVEVVVEKKEIVRHYATRGWNMTVKACAGSYMGALRGNPVLTGNTEQVTCAACLKWIEKHVCV